MNTQGLPVRAGPETSTTLQTLPPGPDTQSRDEALTRTLGATEEEWRRDAYLTVRLLAAIPNPFTAEDIWELINQPVEPRALGAIMMSSARRGIIKPTGRYVQGRRETSHNRPVKEWIGIGYEI